MDRIKPNWCACGIRSVDEENFGVDLFIEYDDIRKSSEDVECTILKDSDIK